MCIWTEVCGLCSSYMLKSMSYCIFADSGMDLNIMKRASQGARMAWIGIFLSSGRLCWYLLMNSMIPNMI